MCIFGFKITWTFSCYPPTTTPPHPSPPGNKAGEGVILELAHTEWCVRAVLCISLLFFLEHLVLSCLDLVCYAFSCFCFFLLLPYSFVLIVSCDELYEHRTNHKSKRGRKLCSNWWTWNDDAVRCGISFFNPDHPGSPWNREYKGYTCTCRYAMLYGLLPRDAVWWRGFYLLSSVFAVVSGLQNRRA